MVQVKLFDCEHEQDLEEEINRFLSDLEHKQVVDIKYNIAALREAEDEQIYCFSAMVMYIK
ncbi:sporulation protein cse60 [Siminovitchia terrae]|uniref:sporulation protein cse60 n=1 Tax=Siminovitchia terrae TaxID=1914933 RepID=A0A429X1A9_SIMTE|nr:sporulation protein Cse60 [Siminovitchia terrae]RST57246.1 sporulation protein Cse60 [Siminovitchia terrae]GIN93069.1 sporulation protein cse60 [Siminovitchia terrae]GIN98802.1 sporulation protein cse60 [Siminovitchia terrae]